MSDYNVTLNGTTYELNSSFRDALEHRAELEYQKNSTFSCWWNVAEEPDPNDPHYERAKEQWENNIHESGDPILTIETDGVMVPWDSLDKLETEMIAEQEPDPPQDDPDEIDEGGGMKTVDPDTPRSTNNEIFGRNHFALTPHRFEEVPSPGGDDPEKIPQEPEKLDESMLVLWVPRHPDVEHTWSAGEAMIPMSSWVEWNVQKRADQPQPSKDKDNSHDRFESLCHIHDCEVVEEKTAGSVKRKGQDSFKNGKFGGNNFHI